MIDSYNKNNLTQDTLFEIRDFEENRTSRTPIEMFELYYTSRKEFGKLTCKEDLFVSFLDVMTKGRAFTYTKKVTDDIFLGKVGLRPVLFKLVKTNKVKDRKALAEELNNIALELSKDGHSVERTYVLRTKSDNMSDLELVSLPSSN